MNEKTYNMYLRMMKLACNNIQYEICRINGLSNIKLVQVRIRNKEQLINYVGLILQNSTDAVALYSNKIDPLLIVSTEVMISHTLTPSVVFINSIIKSKEARVCQKQLMDYTMAEMYLNEAYLYDIKHPYNQVVDSALEKAKDIITKIYSLTFLSNFVFDCGKPKLEENTKANLVSQAFDKRYAFTDEATNEKLIRKKYAAEFGSRTDFFLMDAAERKKALKMDSVKNAGKLTPSTMSVLEEHNVSSDTLMITELYKSTFANLPLQNRRRKFVNLKVRNRDIMLCPRRNLVSKKQYANIESMTKHHYIYDFYDDQIPVDIVDTNDYYFSQEVHMYQYMWNTTGLVHNNNGKLYFPDGTNLPITKGMQAYEFLHKINTVYAALFGFSPDDMRGGKNWLYDSIRRAYTDEGTADYRLAMIDARISGKI